VAACADGSSTTSSASGGGAIDHPTGADQLVLRVATGGGFTAPGYQLRTIPEFSLYGDGSIITPGPQIEIYPPPALPSVQTQPVSEDGVQAILRSAIDAGVVTGVDMTDMGSTMVADAATTTFTISVDGTTNTFGVYALGIVRGGDCPDGMAATECDARTALSSFVRQLGRLDRWLPSGSLGETAPYEPSGSRVYVGEARHEDQLPQPEVAWPLGTPLASFGEDTGTGYRCGVVTEDDWATLQPVATGTNELTPWTSDGSSYGLVFRPLLPDETGC
jgi:hypothetical protein